MNRHTRTLLGIAIASLIVAMLGAGCGSKSGDRGKAGGDDAADPEKKTTYICPMHPQVVSDKPGDCPICNMRLVPAESSSEDAMREHSRGSGAAVPDGYAAIEIDSRQRELVGLRLAAAQTHVLAREVRTVGQIVADETRLHHVHTRVGGYVTEDLDNFIGKRVRKGDPLASLYSPELLAAQEELLLARRSASGEGGTASSIALAARRRLILAGVSEHDIDAIESRGEPSQSLPIYSPASGVITARFAFHGMKVSPEDVLYDVVDLSHVWALADIYESDIAAVRTGDSASVTLASWPGRAWRGRIDYLPPLIDAGSRTAKARIDLDNADGALKPDMYATVVISGDAQALLAIPEDAVTDAGPRQIVFVAAGGDRFEPREVTIGARAGGLVEIVAGLAPGDSVAVAANFLLDSESRLRAAVSAASTETESPPSAGRTHHNAY